jgi:putative transcriptional regulator
LIFEVISVCINYLLNFSELIREVRHRLNLTQEKLAQEFGVTFATINRWERGKGKPSSIAMQLIRAKLEQIGEPVEDLLNKYFSN